MSINTRKTVILAQCSDQKPTILLDGVDQFCYQGSNISSNLSLDIEIRSRISKVVVTLGRLSTRVWKNNHLSTRTKTIVYQSCILSTLLYGAETPMQSEKDRQFPQALSSKHAVEQYRTVSWRDKVTNERTLQLAQLPRFRWLGYVHRMDATRLPRPRSTSRSRKSSPKTTTGGGGLLSTRQKLSLESSQQAR